MPVYNDENFVEDAIESVNLQTFKDIELICVNDGSSDSSLDILNTLSLKYDFIKVFSQNNQGAGSARNKGLDNANGEYIAFLDADDLYVDENALEIMYNIATKNNADMVSANLVQINRNRLITDINPNCKHKYLCFSEYCEIKPDDYGIPWSFYKNLFRFDVIEKNNIRFPNLLRGQDPVFLTEFLSKINIIYGVPVSLYGYMDPPPEKNLLNTKIKKEHYLIHYKMTFEILKENEMDNILSKYISDFVKRLNSFISNNDVEGYEIFLDIFGRDTEYLKGFEKNNEYFYISYLFDNILIKDSEEYFNFIKEELSYYKFWDNEFLTKDLLRKIFLILDHNEYFPFKEDYLELNYNLNSAKIRNLSKENKKIRRKHKKLKKLNNELLTSNSLKIAGFFKKLFKKK